MRARYHRARGSVRPRRAASSPDRFRAMPSRAAPRALSPIPSVRSARPPDIHQGHRCAPMRPACRPGTAPPRRDRSRLRRQAADGRTKGGSTRVPGDRRPSSGRRRGPCRQETALPHGPRSCAGDLRARATRSPPPAQRRHRALRSRSPPRLRYVLVAVRLPAPPAPARAAAESPRTGERAERRKSSGREP